MSHSQTVATKTIAAVERAREEVNSFKAHVEQLISSESTSEQEVGKSLTHHVTRAESLVVKAEATVRRMRQVGRVPPRPTASTPPALRAKRALSVLLSGLDSSESPTEPSSKAATDEADISADIAMRNVKQKVSASSVKPAFLSAAGKPAATPIREDEIGATLQRVAREADLPFGRMGPGSRGIWFECRNVFRAFVWFKETDPPGEKPPLGETPKHSYIVPEHIGCFGVDESHHSRWSCSRYSVFNVITERANAAIRYFMAREATGEEAFVALAKWLARHKTLFTAKYEDRRLAFDASRGIFLPCCVYPFEGNGGPRFTRGSIPVRSNSSYAAQPTVRLPSGAQNGQTQNVQANALNAVQAPPGSGTAPVQGGPNAEAPTSRPGTTVAKQQPVPVTTSGSRGNTADTRAVQNQPRS